MIRMTVRMMVMMTVRKMVIMTVRMTVRDLPTTMQISRRDIINYEHEFIVFPLKVQGLTLSTASLVVIAIKWNYYLNKFILLYLLFFIFVLSGDLF